MKSPLILLNCLLAGGVCFAFVSNLKNVSREEQVVPVKRVKKVLPDAGSESQITTQVLTTEQKVQKIVSAKILNPGGGIGVRYTEADPYIDIDDTLKLVGNHMHAICEETNYPMPQILMEPGRSLVADAGVTLYEVQNVKTITGYKRICKEGPIMEKEEILWED